MDIFKTLLGILPKRLEHRIAVILAATLLVHGALYLTVGATRTTDSLREAETDTFTITPTDSGNGGDVYTLTVNDNKDRYMWDLVHDPPEGSTTGDVRIEAVVHDPTLHLKGIELEYGFDGGETRRIAMDHRFTDKNNETVWWVDVPAGEGSVLSYSIHVTYLPWSTDVYRYHDRTTTVMDGDMLYRDTGWRTEYPPLMTYALLPAHLLAQLIGPEKGFSIYFIAFSIATALGVYLLFRRWGEDRAFLMGLVASMYPSMLIAPMFSQDDPLIVFVMMLVMYMVLSNRHRLAALGIGMGITMKMWTVLLFPGLLGDAARWEENAAKRVNRTVGLTVVPAAFILALFWSMAGSDFLYFLKIYTGFGGFDDPLGSYSIWYTLFGNTSIYSGLKAVLMVIIALGTLVFFRRFVKGGIHPVRFHMVVLLLFLMFYFKVYNEYYGYLMVVLLPLMVEDRIALVEMYAIPLLLLLAPLTPASVVVFILLADILRRVLLCPYRFDNDLGCCTEDGDFKPLEGVRDLI